MTMMPGQPRAAYEEPLRRYFRPIPAKPNYTSIYFTLALGGTILLLGVATAATGVNATSASAGAAICCAVPLGLGGAIAVLIGGINYFTTKGAYEQQYALSVPKPTDQEVEQILRIDLDQLQQLGLRRLNLVHDDLLGGRSPDAPPEMLRLIAAAPHASGKVGLDGKARFTSYIVMFVYLSGWHMSIFICHLDFIRGLHLNEETKEYHYEDVVGVETKRIGVGIVDGYTQPQPPPLLPPPAARPALLPGAIPPSVLVFPDGRTLEITVSQLFRLLIKSGDRVEMAITVQDTNQINFDAQNPTDADQTIRKIQNELRAKKGGFRRPPDYGPPRYGDGFGHGSPGGDPGGS